MYPMKFIDFVFFSFLEFVGVSKQRLFTIQILERDIFFHIFCLNCFFKSSLNRIHIKYKLFQICIYIYIYDNMFFPDIYKADVKNKKYKRGKKNREECKRENGQQN